MRHLAGTATYVSAPRRSLADNTFRVQIPWATFDLNGIATVTTSASGRSRVRALQGDLQLYTVGEPSSVRAGERVCLTPSEPPRIGPDDSLACE